MTYISLLKEKVYLGVIIIFICALLGSVLGARKESKEPLNGIIQSDIDKMQQINEPIMIGQLPLAANQNNWYNFQYAVLCAGIGCLLYLICIAIYLPLYEMAFFVWIRTFFKQKDGEGNLFIKI